MVRFYVLTSHNIYALRRQFKTLSRSNTTVVINTLDLSYLEEAERFCCEEKIHYVITESDGTATTGKNSVLDVFEDSPYEYCVLVDGDDYITERGVKYYSSLRGVDAIALWKPVVCYSERKRQSGDEHLDPATLPFKMSTTSVVTDWSLWREGRYLVDWASFELEEGDLEFWNYYHGLLEKYFGMDQLSARVTFMSRRCIPYRFRKYTVGEDVLQYLELKDAHEKGKLKLYLSDEKNPTYIHDLRLSGISQIANETIGFFNWLRTLCSGIEEFEKKGMLHETRLSAWH